MAFKLTFGFDKPLTFRWKFHLPELVSAIKRSIRSEFNTAGGEFTRSWQLRNLHVTPDGEGVQITSEHPAARIQEFGGPVPERVAKRANAMHWTGPAGEVFAKRAKGFNLRPRKYLQGAIKEWSGTESGIGVEWTRD